MHWHCWRDTSHKGTNLFQLLKRINAKREDFDKLKSILNKTSSLQDFDSNVKFNLTQQKFKTKKIDKLPEEFISLKEEGSGPHYTNAYRYIMKDRKLSKDDIIKYNIGYCATGKYGGYIIIPSYGEDMNINYFIARSFYNSPMKYKNPSFKKDVVFNELFISWKKPIILCEGVFDMMAIKRNAIPILGKYIQPQLKLKLLTHSVKNIYVALDKDAVKDSLNIIQEFLKNDINVYFVNLSDKDPGEMGFTNVWKAIRSAKKIEFEDLIKMKLQTN